MADKPADKTEGKSSEKPTDKPEGNPPHKQAGKTAHKPANKPAEPDYDTQFGRVIWESATRPPQQHSGSHPRETAENDFVLPPRLLSRHKSSEFKEIDIPRLLDTLVVLHVIDPWEAEQLRLRGGDAQLSLRMLLALIVIVKGKGAYLKFIHALRQSVYARIAELLHDFPLSQYGETTSPMKWSVIEPTVSTGSVHTLYAESIHDLRRLCYQGGPVDEIKRLIEKGADLTATCSDGRTVLHDACSGGNEEIIALLLQRGTDVTVKDKDGNTLLHLTTMRGDQEPVKLLLQHGANVNVTNNDGYSPIHVACERGYHELATLFLEYGVDVNATTKQGFTPLYCATQIDNQKGRAEIISLLLGHDADVNIPYRSGNTLLHVAIHRGNEELAALLLQHGAEVNVPNWNHDTSLHFASQRRHKKYAALLFQHDADVNAKNNQGDTPLHIACQTDGISALLIQHGADVNAANSQGDTPLHFASRIRHGTPQLTPLLQHGADVNAINKEGNTPLHVAIQNRNADTAHTLLTSGADPTIANNKGNTWLHEACYSALSYAINTDQHSAVSKCLNAKNNEGSTPLHIASQKWNGNAVHCLLTSGADPSIANNKGNTWLHEACRCGQTDVLQSLTQKEQMCTVSKCLNAKNDEGNTPLHIAIQSSNDDFVSILLRCGADPKIVNNKGNTWLHEACYRADSCAIETVPPPDIVTPHLLSRLVFSKRFHFSSDFSSSGGHLQGDSDVILIVPGNAVGKSETATISGAVSVDLQAAHEILQLGDRETIVSPIVEYCTDRDGGVFGRNLQIYLPHFLPDLFSKQCVRVYMFHTNSDGRLCVETLRKLESQEVGKDNETKEKQAAFCFTGSDGILVLTSHFTGVVCTYCGKLSPQLHLRLYGTHVQRKTRHVDMKLLIGDKRMEIRDFRQGTLSAEEDHAIVTKNLGRIDDIVNMAVGARLVVTEECWMYRNNRFPSEQRVDLDEIRPCCDDSLPQTIDWELEHRADVTPNVWFECHVEAGYTRVDETTFIFFSKPSTKILSVSGLRLQNEQRSTKTQTDGDPDTNTYVKQLFVGHQAATLPAGTQANADTVGFASPTFSPPGAGFVDMDRRAFSHNEIQFENLSLADATRSTDTQQSVNLPGQYHSQQAWHGLPNQRQEGPPSQSSQRGLQQPSASIHQQQGSTSFLPQLVSPGNPQQHQTGRSPSQPMSQLPVAGYEGLASPAFAPMPHVPITPRQCTHVPQGACKVCVVNESRTIQITNNYNLNVGQIKGNAVTFGPTTHGSPQAVGQREEPDHLGAIDNATQQAPIEWTDNDMQEFQPAAIGGHDNDMQPVAIGGPDNDLQQAAIGGSNNYIQPASIGVPDNDMQQAAIGGGEKQKRKKKKRKTATEGASYKKQHVSFD